MTKVDTSSYVFAIMGILSMMGIGFAYVAHAQMVASTTAPTNATTTYPYTSSNALIQIPSLMKRSVVCA